MITGLDPANKVAMLRDGTRLPYDLFLGVPIHRAPEVVHTSGLAVDGWIPVDKVNLATRFPGVYAVGDVSSAPVPKAGVFAESAGRTVAEDIISKLRNGDAPAPYDGAGTCYVDSAAAGWGASTPTSWADHLRPHRSEAPHRKPRPRKTSHPLAASAGSGRRSDTIGAVPAAVIDARICAILSLPLAASPNVCRGGGLLRITQPVTGLAFGLNDAVPAV